MRESKNLEFKEKISDSFLKTVVAFSNYDGGRILFGVNDDGDYVGLNNLKSDAISIENKINDSISPRVNYNIEIDDVNRIIELIIFPGNFKPYFYKSKSYKRNDSSTVEVDNLELKKLILESNNLSFDSMVLDKTNYNFKYLENKFKDKLNIEKFSPDILKTLELIDKNGFLTNAGLLLSDENNFKIINIIRFGENRNIILNRFKIEGVSLLEAFDFCINKFRDFYQYEFIDGSYREKRSLIPENAFREAIANALVHRDWMTNSYIQISMESDFISIVSPGGLPSGISESEYLNGQISILRNPIIGNVFFRLNIIENFGTGIRRIKDSYAISKKNPSFKIFENSIEVTLPVFSISLNLSKDEEKVYAAIGDGKVPSSYIVEATGFGKSKVLKLIDNLIEQGFIIKSGNGRSTKYSIK